ncbi:bcl-2-interacting killer [Antennarius striatus]|uniref:bcl-2-interacting killer n=1 Tax=Antennarius striatus TaxID=241820 RepID=UPI0035B2FD59
MVEQTRQLHRVVSLQAGPGEVDSDVNLRVNGRAARVIGRQLAAIGDHLNQKWIGRQPNWLPSPLQVLRPAETLTRTFYRDIHSQLWGFHGLSAALKSWIMSTDPGQGGLKVATWAAWASHFKPVICPGWTGGTLVTVALVAAVTFLLHCGWNGNPKEP